MELLGSAGGAEPAAALTHAPPPPAPRSTYLVSAVYIGSLIWPPLPRSCRALLEGPSHARTHAPAPRPNTDSARNAPPPPGPSKWSQGRPGGTHARACTPPHYRRSTYLVSAVYIGSLIWRPTYNIDYDVVIRVGPGLGFYGFWGLRFYFYKPFKP